MNGPHTWTRPRTEWQRAYQHGSAGQREVLKQAVPRDGSDPATVTFSEAQFNGYFGCPLQEMVASAFCAAEDMEVSDEQ